MKLDDLIPPEMAAGRDIAPATEWSQMQQDIFDAVAHLEDNLSIEAVAGSGKTTTIVEAMKYTSGNVLFLAFNKSIATELETKTPFHVECRTFNSLGHRLLMKQLGAANSRPKLEKWKLANLLRPHMSTAEYREWGNDLIKIIGMSKGGGFIEEPNDADFMDWLEFSEVPMDRLDYAVPLLRDLWFASLDVTKEFTFDDQLFMPIYWSMNFPVYDTVFVDEAQDLNEIQHMMLQKLADQGARIIAVGDSRQAIYGFRGALTNSMQKLNSRFNCTELPLSVCYRCGKDIVNLAKHIVPQIEWFDKSPDGTITHHSSGIHPKNIMDESLVMCRTNAPIFAYAVQFLKHRVPCMVMSNFGEQLIKFVKKQDAHTTKELSREIEKWRVKEISLAEDRELYHKINRINDKAASLLPFCVEYQTKLEVVEALERLLRSRTGPKLCTIHKAKGLEAKTAYLLCPDLVPAPWIEVGTEEYAQETNLRYVAITRAQENLVFMEEFTEDEYEEE